MQTVGVHKVSAYFELWAPMKKAAPKSGFFWSAMTADERLRLGLSSLAEHRDGDVNQHVGVQRHADRMVTRGLQRTDGHANL